MLAQPTFGFRYRLMMPQADGMMVDAKGTEHDEQFESTVRSTIKNIIRLATAHHLPRHSEHSYQTIWLLTMLVHHNIDAIFGKACGSIE